MCFRIQIFGFGEGNQVHTLQKWTVLKETGIKNKGHAEVKKIKRKQT